MQGDYILFVEGDTENAGEWKYFRKRGDAIAESKKNPDRYRVISRVVSELPPRTRNILRIARFTPSATLGVADGVLSSLCMKGNYTK